MKLCSVDNPLDEAKLRSCEVFDRAIGVETYVLCLSDVTLSTTKEVPERGLASVPLRFSVGE